MADTTQVADSGTGPQPNNPLSRKLNKVLETRLDNDKVGAHFGQFREKRSVLLGRYQGVNFTLLR